MNTIPAISIRQPWLFAILHLGKTIENRSWATSYRGPLLLHASKSYDSAGEDECLELGDEIIEQKWNAPGDIFRKALKSADRGGIIGLARITDCVKEHDSEWFFGPYGFILKDAHPLCEFVPSKGQLGIYQVPATAAIKRVIQETEWPKKMQWARDLTKRVGA